MALPPVSYLEHEAAVEKTKAAIASIESELELKKQEIDYLSQVPNLDPIILSHEQVKLAELKRNHTAAVRDYQLAMGKLQSAKDNRKYQEYQASVNAARRVEEMNQSRLNYQRQLAEYEQRLADREFQVSQLQAKLNDVSNAIASLATVKAPYSGTVRRIRWLGQSPRETIDKYRQSESPLWSMEGNRQSGIGNREENRLPTHDSLLPCMDSSNECVNELTEKAIANSNKLKKLDEKIALIDQRLELMDDRIAYSQKKTWTNYVTLDERETATKPLRRW